MQRSEEADKTLALQRVNLLAQAAVEPTLSSPEVEGILEECRRAFFWMGENTYRVGDVVVPTNPTGLRYRCMVMGESDADEPDWPVDDPCSVSDGEVTWASVGQDYGNIFNVEEAIYKAWLVKAAKVVPEVDQTYSGGGAIGTFASKCGQLIQHCLDMARR